MRIAQPDQSVFPHDVTVIVGGYGSGKSEVAVNLARWRKQAGSRPVALADLDLINPYFRSREAVRQLEALGIRTLVPPGEHCHADLPIVIPEVKGAIQRPEGYLILDVGGDDLGARVLSSLSDAFLANSYNMILVHNANRPFSNEVEGTQRIMREIESASRLRFSGVIANTHLMDDTTPETILDGLKVSREVAEAVGIPLLCITTVATVADQLDPKRLGVPVLVLERNLLKPWEGRSGSSKTERA